MSKETLLQLVERLRKAGQRYHDYTYINMVAGVKLCPAAPGGEAGAPCMCGANEHNKKCDAAAKALVAEIEDRKNCLSAEEKLAAVLKAVDPVMEKFYSDAEGEKERTTLQDAIQHLGDVIEGIGDPE